MPCLVRLYDKAFLDLNLTSIDLVAIDQGPPPTNCCAVQANRPVTPPGLRSGYGADLTFASGALVYQVAIHDRSGTVAGTTIPDLNGNHSGELDVVLHAAPAPGSNVGRISAPASPTQARTFIDQQPNWTDENRLGIYSVITALSQLTLLSRPSIVPVGAGPNPTVMGFIAGYSEFLGNRGIDPAIF